MKKLLVLLSITLICSFALSSCFFLGPSVKGNGNVTTEYRDVGDFDKVKVSTGLKVVLIQSDKNLVTVETDENLHEVIRTEVKRGELNIFTEGRIKQSRKLLITVELIDLDELQSSSGAQVSTDGMLRLKHFSTKASSGSQQKLSLNTQKLEAKTSSGAQIRMDGKTGDADYSASSGSHLKAGELVAKSGKADVSSGAHIYMEVTSDFEGEASSGGHIYYSGNPSSVDIKTSSGGNIIKQ
jgi:hypothetical protein